MLRLSNTSDTIVHYKDMQNTPTWKVSIWEEAYQANLDLYWKLINDKAQYCHRLEQEFLNTIDPDKANRINWQITRIQKELHTLTAFKSFMEQLKTAYLQSTDWLYIATRKMENQYLKKLDEYKQRAESKEKAYKVTALNCSKYRDVLIAIETELNERAIILTTKIDSSWAK